MPRACLRRGARVNTDFFMTMLIYCGEMRCFRVASRRQSELSGADRIRAPLSMRMSAVRCRRANETTRAAASDSRAVLRGRPNESTIWCVEGKDRNSGARALGQEHPGECFRLRVRIYGVLSLRVARAALASADLCTRARRARGEIGPRLGVSSANSRVGSEFYDEFDRSALVETQTARRSACVSGQR